jgi:hypothetical protein
MTDQPFRAWIGAMVCRGVDLDPEDCLSVCPNEYGQEGGPGCYPPDLLK